MKSCVWEVRICLGTNTWHLLGVLGALWAGGGVWKLRYTSHRLEDVILKEWEWGELLMRISGAPNFGSGTLVSIESLSRSHVKGKILPHKSQVRMNLRLAFGTSSLRAGTLRLLGSASCISVSQVPWGVLQTSEVQRPSPWKQAREGPFSSRTFFLGQEVHRRELGEL